MIPGVLHGHPPMRGTVLWGPGARHNPSSVIVLRVGAVLVPFVGSGLRRRDRRCRRAEFVALYESSIMIPGVLHGHPPMKGGVVLWGPGGRHAPSSIERISMAIIVIPIHGRVRGRDSGRV